MISTTALVALLPALAAAAPLAKRATGIPISFNGDQSKCLTVYETSLGAGSLVVAAPCGLGGKQAWDISLGENPSVKLTGTNFCLDAGYDYNSNFQQLERFPQQNWYLTGDDHIAITGGSTCLNLADGKGKVQTYQCGSSNEVWITGLNGGGPSSTSAAPPVSSSSAVVSSSSAPAPSSTPAAFNVIKGDGHYDNQCLTVMGGSIVNDAKVALATCDVRLSSFQRWQINYGSTKVRVDGTNYCLDASSNPGNGVGSKIYQCFDGLPAQQWYLTNDQHLALEGNNQCLDVKAESGPTSGDYPAGYGSNKDLQTWQCSGPDQNQLFVLA